MCRVSPSRSGCSGVTPCVPALSAPATDRFPGMPRKAGSGRQLPGPFVFPLFLFFFFLEQNKRVGTPPSREPRTGNRQTESALSLDCSPAQTARCAFNTFESDMWPAAVRFFFFFLSLSVLLLFHRGLLRSGIFISVIGRERALGRRTEDTGEDMTRRRRLRERMEAKGGQMVRAGGRARSCEPSPRDPNMVSCSFQWSFSPSASAEKVFGFCVAFILCGPIEHAQ